MPVTVYGMKLSPPVRTVLISAEALNQDYELKVVNLFAGEHKSPEFLKLNPLHTIPTIDDNGTILFDSHAVAPYLVAKYGKDDSLYPKDLVTKARVDQRLHFDSGSLFARLKETVMVIFAGGSEIPEDVKTRTRETLTLLEALLGDNDWIAHTRSFTVADIALLSTLENIEAVVSYLKEYPKLTSWLQRGRTSIPGFEKLTKEGIAEFTDLVVSKLKKGK